MTKNQKAILGALTIGATTYALASNRRNRMMNNMYDMHDMHRAKKKMRKMAKEIL